MTALLAWDVATTVSLRPPRFRPEPDPDLSGSWLGGCRLLCRLGQGGAGVVYLAEEAAASPPSPVAVKLPSRAFPEEARRRLAAEGEILARVEHPGVIRRLGGGVSPEGEPYLILEWIDGLPLTAFCDDHRLPPAGRLALFAAVCRVVGDLHRQGLAHLDLKPANVLIDRGGNPRLIDFGLARRLGGGAAETEAEAEPAGFSPSYASPEQILGAPLSPASDVYSLGIVLHELWTGWRPRPGSLALPADLARVVEACLEPSPCRRPATAEALASALPRG